MARRKREPREVEVQIQSMDQKGRGVARLDGKVMFIAGALPGETVRATVKRGQRRYEEGSADEILVASPERVEPGCRHFGLCGGCGLQHQAAEAQILSKQQKLLEDLQHIGGVCAERVLEPLTGPVWGYRRRARLGVRRVDKKDKVLVGFRERGGRYLADLSGCEVLDTRVGGRLEELGQLVDGLSIPHDIPQIEVAAGEDRVCLVLRVMKPLSEADRERLADYQRRTGLQIALQPGGPEAVITLDGSPVQDLSYHLAGYDLELFFQPTEFVQVNAALNERMVARALELLDPQADEHVLDLFCGSGNFSLPIARHARQVTGVEGDLALVRRAERNALHNGIENTDFHVANLFEGFEDGTWTGAHYHKALVDPPRTGAREVLPLISSLGIDHLVYVSCNPATLARDAGILVKEFGYRLMAAGVMDMFPHTAHVESVALFRRG